MKWLLCLALGCAVLGAAPSAHAHHGRDFLFSQTADLPHPGEIYFLPHQDYIDEADTEEIELEPAVLFGAFDWLSLEAHAHIAKEGGDPFEYESTGGALHSRVTPRGAKLGAGISAEYEVSHVDELGDRIEVRLVGSRSFSRGMITLNVVAEDERDDGEDVEWGYAVGARRAFSGRASLGFEAQGSLERSDHEVLGGLYLDPTSWLTVNAGVGAGLGDSEIDFSVHTALVFRLGRIGSGAE